MKLSYFTAGASALADKVDVLFYALLGVSMATIFAICAVIIFFCIRYRRNSTVNRNQIQRRDRTIEVVSITVPLIIFMIIFVWGAELYKEEQLPPANAMQIFVVAKQWMWELQHAGGQRELNELHVPSNVPVKLVMTSQDVIHSFYLPAFRIKQDVLPGRYTVAWFQATHPGVYRLLCAEYCGTDHSVMRGKIVVLAPQDYEKWLRAGQAAPSMEAEGATVFEQYGCPDCHKETPATGPVLRGLYGQRVLLQGGRTVVADDRYIRDSLLRPRQDVVAGYVPVMPTYEGQLNEEQIGDVIAYIKSLHN